MYGNYQYSLDSNEQSSIQLFLRTLRQEAIDNAIGGRTAWDLLHELTYTDSWTETPQFEAVKAHEAADPQIGDDLQDAA